MIGDQADCLARIKSLLPPRWFGDSSPVLDAVLSGVAYTLSAVYSLTQYAKLQARIATATDGFLDLISYDYFGTKLPRRKQEMDNAFRSRILATLLREKVTRNGMIEALINLTGRTPLIFEPARPLDSGTWNSPGTGWSTGAGKWGSLGIRAQVFITAYRPSSSGIPNIAGWNASAAGWSRPGQQKWSSRTQVQGAVTDADIYALIAATVAEGVTAWVRISD